MSARSGNWSLLCHDRDPVPGNPDEAERLAGGYESTASDIQRLAGQLRRLSNLEGWTGDAAETFGEAAEDLADDLRKAERRYRDLAAAVRGWVEPLRTARDESARALGEAEAADEDRKWYDTDGLAGVADPTPAQIVADQQRQDLLADALAAKRAARDRLEQALTALEGAAARTAERIRAVARDGADRWWNDFGGWVRDHAEVLGKIADILGYVALALAAIGLVVALFFTGPVWLVAGLFWAGMAVGVAQLGIHSSMVLSDAGDATWLDVAMDVIGIATAGVGRIVGKGLSKAVQLTGRRVAQEGGNAARTARDALERGVSNYRRAESALGIGDPSNNLRIWGRQYIDDATQRVVDAGADEAARISGGVITQASRLQRVLTLDKDLAADLAELRRLAPEAITQDLKQEVGDLLQRAVVNQGANVGNTAAQAADSTDQVSGDLQDLLSDRPEDRSPLEWKEPTAEAVTRAQWRLTQGW